MTIDSISVIRMSDNSKGAKRTRPSTSSLVTQVRLCKTFLASAGFNSLDGDPEEEEERVIERV